MTRGMRKLGRGGMAATLAATCLATAAGRAGAQVSADTLVGAEASGARGRVAADTSARTAARDSSAAARAREILQRNTRLSGSATVAGELYGAHGIEARRPGGTWRMALTPQLNLFGRLNVSMNALVSSEGSELTTGVRHSFTQLGVSPRWSWGTAHLGDFSQDLSPYTVSGVRVRGAGVELRPGALRFSVQGGRSQRMLTAGLGEPVYKRYLMAASAGLGDHAGTYIDVGVVKVKDDVASMERALIRQDTILLDTLPEFLRPRIDTRPQENLVASVAGQTVLFGRALTLKGELAGALITHDLTSPRANPGAVDAPEFLDRVQTLRLSSSADYAFNVESSLDLRSVGLTGGYEYIGAGYTSLGLPYLIGDRRSYRAGANTRLLDSRIVLQGQYQHQNDNLLDQKRATTNRDVVTATLMLRPADVLTATISGVTSVIANDAAVDTFQVDNRTYALNTSTALQASLLRLPALVSLGYGLQVMEDGNAVYDVPGVTVHNVTTSLQLNVLRGLSLTPSVSGVLKRVDGQEDEENLLLGFRGQARMLDGRFTAGASVTHSFAQGREVFSTLLNAGYDLPLGARLGLQGRLNRFAAFANRPAFREEFVTLSLTRSF